MNKMPADNRIVYRYATAEDIDKMTELDEICFEVPWSRADFEKEMTSNPLALYIIAEHEGELIGYAGLWCILDEGHITNVAVHPEYRQNNVGRNLVGKMISEAKKKSDAKNFTLEVRVSNEAAIRLYEGFGFKSVGVRKAYYSDNKEDAAIMWLMEDREQI